MSGDPGVGPGGEPLGGGWDAVAEGAAVAAGGPGAVGEVPSAIPGVVTGALSMLTGLPIGALAAFGAVLPDTISDAEAEAAFGGGGPAAVGGPDFEPYLAPPYEPPEEEEFEYPQVLTEGVPGQQELISAADLQRIYGLQEEIRQRFAPELQQDREARLALLSQRDISRGLGGPYRISRRQPRTAMQRRRGVPPTFGIPFHRTA